MSRLLCTASLILVGWFSLPAAALENLEPYVVGNAFSAEDGAWLYSEYHRCDAQGSQCLIEYRDPDGVLLAKKALDYSGSPHAPGVFLQDFVYEESLRIAPLNDTRQVVDAGFDNFVRSSWQGLASGETVTFPFQVLGREEPIDMRAARSEQADCADTSLCLEVALDAWLLRLVVPSIELVYDRESRRLLSYRGISNLRDEGGASPMVFIRYEYQAEPAVLAAGEGPANIIE